MGLGGYGSVVSTMDAGGAVGTHMLGMYAIHAQNPGEGKGLG